MRSRVFTPCLVVLALGSWHCEEYGPRIYTARLYRVGARCLEPSTPIGVVQAGELHANCDDPPQCLALDGELYVSSVCPPLPARASAMRSDLPACVLALTAFEAKATCGALDAGLDARTRLDGGFDAGLDTGLDASALENSAGR
jgi:hypothetical protein